LTNTRKDEYGGRFENRVRFPKQIIEMIRDKVGPDYPLGIRMAGNDFVPGSVKDTETPKIAQVYEKAGIDVINVTGGWHESKIPQLPMELPRSGFSYLAMNIKQAVSVPVMASNRIATPDHAEQILKDGQADMVNLGRVLLADPFWPEKAKNGRPEEIRPCVACSQGCTDELFSGHPVSCIGNVRTGFEGERNIVKSASPKNVMVVGAGVAGLEAAITAKKAGHNVEIYEKTEDIGGQIWIAAAPPHKGELLEYIRYYRAMLKKYEIPVHLNTPVDLDLIKKINPDHVMIAQGAKPIVPPIKGADDQSILSSWDVLKNSPCLGKNVAVIGGGSVGLETAFSIAKKGTLSPDMLHFLVTYDAMELERLKHYMFNGSSKVTLFEMLDKVGQDIGKSTKWVLMGNLKQHGVKIKTSTKVISIKDGVVEFENNGDKTKEQFDNVILASGSMPVQDIEKQLENQGISFTAIGDCVTPGKINNAILGGFSAAIEI
ncbi:MAG: FAD-dependent oxidoreductase, partial [Desulfobacteraceae bacterium]|nr:FAD-dependent oxidoreductase [Desulfobacteraceae bacterium]